MLYQGFFLRIINVKKTISARKRFSLYYLTNSSYHFFQLDKLFFVCANDSRRYTAWLSPVRTYVLLHICTPVWTFLSVSPLSNYIQNDCLKLSEIISQVMIVSFFLVFFSDRVIVPYFFLSRFHWILDQYTCTCKHNRKGGYFLCFYF